MVTANNHHVKKGRRHQLCGQCFSVDGTGQVLPAVQRRAVSYLVDLRQRLLQAALEEEIDGLAVQGLEVPTVNRQDLLRIVEGWERWREGGAWCSAAGTRKKTCNETDGRETVRKNTRCAVICAAPCPRPLSLVSELLWCFHRRAQLDEPHFT